MVKVQECIELINPTKEELAEVVNILQEEYIALEGDPGMKKFLKLCPLFPVMYVGVVNSIYLTVSDSNLYDLER